MEIKIYIDVLLLINLLFNYLLLWLTGLLLRRHVHTLRLLAIALIGALYAVCVFFLPDLTLYTLPGKLAMGVIMAAAAYRPRCLKALIKYICVFYAAVFILGGAAFCFFYFSDSGALLGAIYRNGTLYINLPVYRLLLLTGLCYGILKATFALGARMAAAGKQIIPLRIVLNGRSVLLKGFYDSGNLLQDPGGRGVIITEWRCVQPLFGRACAPEEADIAFADIPYHTLQGQGKLKAFRPDAMYREQGRRLIPAAPVYIGIVNEPLNYYNNWDAILPHDFEGVENYETSSDPKAVQAFQG
ncbi:MAG: sigma-E processing peptidase SpoIIGA [Clostridia bacterium]